MVLSLFKKREDKIVREQSGGVRYYDLLVEDVIRETDDAITIVLNNPDNKINYKSGQYLTLILQIEGKEERRSYSLSSSPETDNNLAVTVKKVDRGHVSNYLNYKLKAGDKIRILEPMGNFTTEFDIDNERTLLLFAGGSGITPLISIIKTALQKEPKSKVILVYQNKNLNSIIFKDLINQLSKKYSDNFKVIHILSKPESTWHGKSGRITGDMVKKIVAEENVNIENTDVFFCGPSGMMETAEHAMEELGVEKANRHKESFVSSSSKKEKKNVESHSFEESTVTLKLDGEEYQVIVKPNEFILENALDADIDVPFSCQSGLCTTCRGKLVAGKVKMEDPDGLTDDEIAQGYVLTCVSHPASKEIKIEIG